MLRLRHHLRHEQRVRLRLPARQHEVRDRVHGPARPLFRHRGRGGLDPDRRSPHAAHHLGPVGREHRHLRQVQPRHPPPRQGDGGKGQGRQQVHDRRLHRGREVPHGPPDRGGCGEGGEADRRREPLRAHQHRPAARRRAGSPRPHPLQEGRRLHDQGRRGPDRGRVHGARSAGPALVRRPPPGRRGQREREDRAREPDSRHDHLPELLPAVRKARRHDGHGRHRGRRVRPDLQARRRRHPDEPADDPHGPPGRRLHDGRREVRRAGRRDPRAAREGTAGARRHRLDREVRAALGAPEGPEGPPRRPEREVPREGGRDRRPGRQVGLRHDRDQHGGPRNRHRPRREPRGLRRAPPRRDDDPRGVRDAARRKSGRRRPKTARQCWPRAVS